MLRCRCPAENLGRVNSVRLLQPALGKVEERRSRCAEVVHMVIPRENAAAASWTQRLSTNEYKCSMWYQIIVIGFDFARKVVEWTLYRNLRLLLDLYSTNFAIIRNSGACPSADVSSRYAASVLCSLVSVTTQCVSDIGCVCEHRRR